jgi:hypothetical protein
MRNGSPHEFDSGLYPSGVYLHRVRVEQGPREHVRCCPQREMTSGNVGSEETEKPKFLWPESLAHRNMYGSKEVTVRKRRHDEHCGLARDLPVFVRMDGRLLDKEVHRAWAGSRYQGRQRGRGSAAGRTTQRG